MDPRTLELGDVVQLSPAHQKEGGFFAGCLMLVTEPTTWGAMGFVSVPNGPRGELPGRAYYRAKWEEMEYVGRATWVPQDDAESEGWSAP